MEDGVATAIEVVGEVMGEVVEGVMDDKGVRGRSVEARLTLAAGMGRARASCCLVDGDGVREREFTGGLARGDERMGDAKGVFSRGRWWGSIGRASGVPTSLCYRTKNSPAEATGLGVVIVIW